MERPQLHGSFYSQLRLRQPRTGADLWRTGARQGFRTGGISSELRTGGDFGARFVSGIDGETGRFIADGAGPLYTGAVPLPACAGSAAGGEHESAAGYRGQAPDQSRSNVGTHDECLMRYLP